jgi:hypothetical protein
MMLPLITGKVSLFIGLNGLVNSAIDRWGRRSEPKKFCIILITNTSSCANEPVVHRFPARRERGAELETPNGLDAETGWLARQGVSR